MHVFRQLGWVGVLLWGGLGCDGGEVEDTGEAGECTSNSGTLTGVVYEDYPWTTQDSGEGLPQAGAARVRISREDVEPFVAVADADGRYTVELQVGIWELFATDTGGGCVSDDGLSADILPCDTVELDIYLKDCLDGR
ncbi:MAG: hypothetical protein VX519_01810 [Myxococcota bacterium]|nr:hypothetical protein [Myxococcota bacterium]